MAGDVLIVDDEQGSQRLLGELCKELGLATRATALGSEALALAQAQQPALVLLDLVLAESDGFTVASGLRDAGSTVPIVIVSGVYKKLPDDFSAKVRPSAFLPKPFDLGAMRGAIQTALGMKRAEPTQPAESGDLAKKPVPWLYADLARRKATGVLDLTRGQVRKRLFLQGGTLRYAQSNVRLENVGGMQVAEGKLKEAAFSRAVEHAKQARVPLHEALAATRAMAPPELNVALKRQTLEVAANAVAWTDGAFVFTPEASGAAIEQQPDARQNPLQAALEGARRAYTPQSARGYFADKQTWVMGRTPELERELFLVRAAWPGEQLTALFNGKVTVQELLLKCKEAELPLLQALAVCDLAPLMRGSARATPAEAVPASPEAEADDDDGKRFTPPELVARRSIFEERDRQQGKTHYELLSVTPQSSPEQVKGQYLQLAKKFHSDAFSGLELGSAKRALTLVFQHIGEAFSTLNDPAKRSEYDVYLDRVAKGLPTDVNAILKAEAIFQRGQLFLKSGKAADAEAAFREAVSLNGSEAEHHGYLGLAIFRAHGERGAAEALAEIKSALELQPENLSALCAHAAILAETGQPAKATELFEQVLERDPSHADAQIGLRRLKQSRDKQQGGGKGLFGKLFKRS